jgi:hypothetical protein
MLVEEVHIAIKIKLKKAFKDVDILSINISILHDAS